MANWWRRILGRGAPDGSSTEQTTRLTIVSYLDSNGDEATLELAGWVGAVGEMARVDFSEVLGQAYVERPYETRAQAPQELTVADLRSVDGMKRMFQEFAGSIASTPEISRLVAKRLGPEAPHWQIVSARVLRQATRH
jgi:hypothetical protein